MNEALGGRGATYDLIDPLLAEAQPLDALVADMQAGRVSTLLMIDTNPVFTAPGTQDFAAALREVEFSVALAKAPDETSALATWAIPMAHDWETWGDARGHDGTATIMQPMALPLYDGMSAAEISRASSARRRAPTSRRCSETWREQLRHFDAAWQDGTGARRRRRPPRASHSRRRSLAAAAAARSPAVRRRAGPAPAVPPRPASARRALRQQPVAAGTAARR